MIKYFWILILSVFSFCLSAQDSLLVANISDSVRSVQNKSTDYSRFGSILYKMDITESNRFSPDYLDSLENAKKNPWFSFFVSTAFPVPGLGQIYNGDYTTAAVQAGSFILGFLFVANALNGVDRKNPYKAALGLSFSAPQILAGELLMLGSKLWSMADAPMTTNYRNDIIDKKVRNYNYVKKTIFPEKQSNKTNEK